MSWKIIYYESENGTCPVFDFIQKQDDDTKAKVSNSLDLLSEFGITLGRPHVKKLINTNLWELRILGGKSIRIFYILIIGKTFLLLHGFIKKKQKTSQKEIKVAQQRLNNFQERKKDS